MNKQLQKKLVAVSYTNDALNSKTVAKIAEKLSRKQLKAYINGLKIQEKKMTIYVDSAVELTKKMEQEIGAHFGKKQVQVSVDPKLLMGMRVQAGDNLYRLNLHDQLEDLKQYIGE